MEIEPPVPLPKPGQYQETPFPVWKIRSYKPAAESLDHSSIYRLQRMPVPEDSCEIYRGSEAATVAEVKEYARWVVGVGPEPRHYREKSGPVPPSSPSLLHFNSRFESGNLRNAFSLSSSEYQLYLSPDTNSKGHIQWFYFSATPTVPVQAKLSIMNFTKAKCLFVRGMRPWYKVQDGIWERLSTPCVYYQNGARTSLKSGKEVEFYTLSFEFDFKDAQKPVFFAFSQPYLYSTLQSHLRSLSKYSFVKRRTLCYSTLGFPIDLITISSPAKARSESAKRDIVVITSRVHPGETPGSWVMESVLKQLCEEGKSLRDKYVFKLVPMLNPDGVIIGNSRTGIEGADLNRRWRAEDCSAFPQLEALKRLLKKWQAQGRLALFCDLHGHAKACNAFLYGCSKGVEEGFAAYTQVRLFPRILAQLSPFVNYSQCSFKVHKSKSSTARVVMWQELGLSPSYTLESSFFGYTTETGQVREWGREEFAEIGKGVMRALGVYGDLEKERRREAEEGGRSQRREKEHSAVPTIYFHSAAVLRNQVSIRYLKSASSNRPRQASRVKGGESAKGWKAFFQEEELQLAREGRKSALEDLEGSSSGSESDPSEDNLADSERQALEQGQEVVTATLMEKTEALAPSSEAGRFPTEATNSTASVHHSITEDTWFTRSTDKFSPGKPQDFLFRSISFFKSLSTLSHLPSSSHSLAPARQPAVHYTSSPPSHLLPLHRQITRGALAKKLQTAKRDSKRVLLVLPSFPAVRSMKMLTVGSVLGHKTEARA